MSFLVRVASRGVFLHRAAPRRVVLRAFAATTDPLTPFRTRKFTTTMSSESKSAGGVPKLYYFNGRVRVVLLRPPGLQSQLCTSSCAHVTCPV